MPRRTLLADCERENEALRAERDAALRGQAQLREVLRQYVFATEEVFRHVPNTGVGVLRTPLDLARAALTSTATDEEKGQTDDARIAAAVLARFDRMSNMDAMDALAQVAQLREDNILLSSSLALVLATRNAMEDAISYNQWLVAGKAHEDACHAASVALTATNA